VLAVIGISEPRRYGGRALVGGEVERTYWFIKLVFPTPLSPRMITLRRTFFLDAMVGN
jgi:hypothetical protein